MPNTRDEIWNQLSQPWDLIIIGGGITGAGILHEATRLGLRALLVEAHDFASGTSSRSSKLVHGGLRYLKNAQIKTTLESVQERERLLRDGKGLITRLGFLYASLKGDSMPAWVFRAGLVFYDLLARQWSHRAYDAMDVRELCPPLTTPDLIGGYRYFDAQTDDARLVLRVLQTATRAGGFALNYAHVGGLLRDQGGKVRGVVVRDLSPGGNRRTAELQATVVVNAAGPWADEVRVQIGQPRRLRALRGSHLVFPAHRLPLTRAVTFLHPKDGRPVMAIPWEGVTIFGTTDVDHGLELQTDPCISAEEIDYLMSALQKVFPAQELTLSDVQSTWAGIRSVVNTGKANPSQESREHVIWLENGLLTVSGGKLTTFRLMARDALQTVRDLLPERKGSPELEGADGETLETVQSLGQLPPSAGLRLVGRYHVDAPTLVSAALPGELSTIPGSPYLWAELRWAARAEAVIHLDDLLLRRVRLGLVLTGGGLNEIEQIRAIVQPELNWDDVRWEDEVRNYTRLWHRAYSPLA
ncbi:MAG TPA: glycerol-3-phosphate dehydrogenase/oxidase [Anaerolineales bacterium]|nr:glycerol-3-phosphate dehydrogenase/oxidase [Anaerolineales bacterium]